MSAISLEAKKRELGKKLGLTTLEGEIYRALDSLLEEQSDLLRNTGLRVTKNSAGYDIFDQLGGDGRDCTRQRSRRLSR